MIYVEESGTTICIPRHDMNGVPQKMVAKSNINEYTLTTSATNISTKSMFYIFNIDTTIMTVGEYQYILTDDNNNTIESGMMTYGEYNKDTAISVNTPKSNIEFKKR